ncbi:hypothetical protein NDU88_011015 [Pleurodeles waltl]|uniref:Secreted protein n=1 Tax=Pleurodeles waltl TaxID=8319 RepID=A0AAV7RZW9_PLEWA|nr:hypothetical protein NDU88_011015 [Pleurodeles waltl]
MQGPESCCFECCWFLWAHRSGAPTCCIELCRAASVLIKPPRRSCEMLQCEVLLRDASCCVGSHEAANQELRGAAM